MSFDSLEIYIENIVKMGEIAPQEQFLLFSTLFYNLILGFCVKTRTRFSLRDKRLFEIIEVQIIRVDFIAISRHYYNHIMHRTESTKRGSNKKQGPV